MRTVDRLLEALDNLEGFSPAEREVLRFRIDQRPTPEELNAARLRLAPIGNNNGWHDH